MTVATYTDTFSRGIALANDDTLGTTDSGHVWQTINSSAFYSSRFGVVGGAGQFVPGSSIDRNAAAWIKRTLPALDAEATFQVLDRLDEGPQDFDPHFFEVLLGGRYIPSTPTSGGGIGVVATLDRETFSTVSVAGRITLHAVTFSANTDAVTYTPLASTVLSGISFARNTTYTLRTRLDVIDCSHVEISGKLWSGSEPADWDVSATITAATFLDPELAPYYPYLSFSCDGSVQETPLAVDTLIYRDIRDESGCPDVVPPTPLPLTTAGFAWIIGG